MKYIAYGPNMSRLQMSLCCPSAKLLGTGYLLNHRLEFYMYATVEHSRAKGARVPVVVWEIDESHEQQLNHYEESTRYYTKGRRTVKMKDGSEIEGMICLMNIKRRRPPAFDYYKSILFAYISMGFAMDIEKVLTAALRRSMRNATNMQLPNQADDSEGQP